MSVFVLTYLNGGQIQWTKVYATYASALAHFNRLREGVLEDDDFEGGDDDEGHFCTEDSDEEAYLEECEVEQ